MNFWSEIQLTFLSSLHGPGILYEVSREIYLFYSFWAGESSILVFKFVVSFHGIILLRLDGFFDLVHYSFLILYFSINNNLFQSHSYGSKPNHKVQKKSNVKKRWSSNEPDRNMLSTEKIPNRSLWTMNGRICIKNVDE